MFRKKHTKMPFGIKFKLKKNKKRKRILTTKKKIVTNYIVKIKFLWKNKYLYKKQNLGKKNRKLKHIFRSEILTMIFRKCPKVTNFFFFLILETKTIKVFIFYFALGHTHNTVTSLLCFHTNLAHKCRKSLSP